jgi:hypothetical protein
MVGEESTKPSLTPPHFTRPPLDKLKSSVVTQKVIVARVNNVMVIIVKPNRDRGI